MIGCLYRLQVFGGCLLTGIVILCFFVNMVVGRGVRSSQMHHRVSLRVHYKSLVDLGAFVVDVQVFKISCSRLSRP